MNRKQLVLLGSIVSFEMSSLYSMRRIDQPSHSSRLKNFHSKTGVSTKIEHYKNNVQLRVKPQYIVPFCKRSFLSWVSALAALKVTKDATIALGAAAAAEVSMEVFEEHRWLKRDEEEKIEFLAIKEKEIIDSSKIYTLLQQYSGLLRRYSNALQDTAMYEDALGYDVDGTFAAEVDALRNNLEKKYPGTLFDFQKDDEQKLQELLKAIAVVYGTSACSFLHLYKAMNQEAAEVLHLTGIILDSTVNAFSKKVDKVPLEKVVRETKDVQELLYNFQKILETEECLKSLICTFAETHSGKSDSNS